MKTNNKGGRPPANAPRVPMVSLMVRLPQETVDELSDVAARHGVNRQDAIRLAVRNLLELERIARNPRKAAGK